MVKSFRSLTRGWREDPGLEEGVTHKVLELEECIDRAKVSRSRESYRKL